MIEFHFQKSYPNDNLFLFNSFKGMGKYSAVLKTMPSTCTRACDHIQFPHSLKAVKLKANPGLDKERLYLKASTIVGTHPSQDLQASQSQREEDVCREGETGQTGI